MGSEGEAEAEPWILAGDDRGMADERVVRHVLDEAKALKEAELDLHGTLGVSTPRGCSCCSSGLESQDSSPWRSGPAIAHGPCEGVSQPTCTTVVQGDADGPDAELRGRP